MKILLFLAKGFEMMEASAFIDVMGWARNDYGHDLEVVTCGFQKEVISTFGVPIRVETLIEAVDIAAYDALAIPGGFEEYDFYEEAYDERLIQLIRAFDAQSKWIATICVGALPVGKSGILQGRKATTYHLKDGYRQKQLQAFGAQIVNAPIVVDGKIITSYCPQTAAGVAFVLLKILTSEKEMLVVKEAMGF